MTTLEESIAHLAAAVAELQTAAAMDDKTPLGNALALRATLRTLNADGDPHVVLYGDIDGLKAINSTYKHSGGDVAINRVGCLIAEAIKSFPRTSAYRQSGDEFTVISLRTNIDKLTAALTRMLREVDVWYDDHHFSVSMSFGWAEADPAAQVHEWQERAEAAATVAKARGRETVVVAWTPDLATETEDLRERCTCGCSFSVTILRGEARHASLRCPLCGATLASLPVGVESAE